MKFDRVVRLDEVGQFHVRVEPQPARYDVIFESLFSQPYASVWKPYQVGFIEVLRREVFRSALLRGNPQNIR